VRSHFYHKRNGLNRETEVHGGPEILNERNYLITSAILGQ